MNYLLTLKAAGLFLIVFTAFSVRAQTHILSGTLTDSQTGELLLNASVVTENGGTTTNAYGYFSLSLPAREMRIWFNYVGYKPEVKTVDLSKGDVRLGPISMIPSTGELHEVVIKADRHALRRHIESTQMGLIDLPVSLLTKVPSIAGEPDIIKALQLTPGVKRGGEGTIGMYIRGGGVDENLVILDEATVYNAGHVLGFFSVFNTSALKDVQLYKSSFPAAYGGRLSGILDTRMKEGNMERFQMDASIGLISSNLTLQGPIKKDKTSFIVSARRTYLDVITFGTIPYHFYDVNAKINHVIDPQNRIYLSFYKGDDVLSIKPGNKLDTDDLQTSLNLGNAIGSLRWNHIFKDPRLFSNLSLIFTKFRYNIEGQFNNTSLLIASAIRDYGVKADLSFKYNSQHTILFGGQIINHFFNPNIVNTSGLQSEELKSRPGQKIYNTETALYASDDYTVSEKFSVNAGLRITGDIVPDKTYLRAEPRLAGRYLIDKRSSVKASYARMAQYMHLVGSSSISLPTDLWYPVTANIKPGTSDQVSVGYFRSIPKLNLAVSVEGYYKWMQHLIEYREGASLVLNDHYEQELVSGKGRSYGLEFFATKTAGRIQGWIGYSLSYAYRQFDALNNGNKFFARFDRRHDFSLVATYDISKRWSISGNYIYATGSPFTAQISQYIAPTPTFTNIDVLPVYGARNAQRLSGSQRIDLDFTLKSKSKRKLKSDFHIGGYNMLNAIQPGHVTRVLDEKTGKFGYQQQGLFGFIPSVAINFHY